MKENMKIHTEGGEFSYFSSKYSFLYLLMFVLDNFIEALNSLIFMSWKFSLN